VSAVRRVGGQLEVRLFNPSPQDTTVRLAGRHGTLVDLRGNVLSSFMEAFALGPWRIATVQLSD
jgi:hypothetical protein